MRRPIVFSAATAVVLAGSALALGSIPDSAGVIHGCYGPNGSLRVVDTEAGKHCTKSETALDWNQVGPIGATGPAGPQALAVVLREASRQLTLAPGEGDFVSSACQAGEVVLGGGPTNSSPLVTIASTGPSFDGSHSGWSVRFENHGVETVTFTPSVGAECVLGTMSSGSNTGPTGPTGGTGGTE